MTSNWLLAERARVEPDLVCPACGAVNIAGRPSTVHVEPRGEAACDQCGHGGPIVSFQPTKEQ